MSLMNQAIPMHLRLAALESGGLLSDADIKYLAEEEGMIAPFNHDRFVQAGKLSTGLSSYGYDVTLGREFAYVVDNEAPLSPKTVTERDFYRTSVQLPFNNYILKPSGFVLGVTVERFHIPQDIMVIALGKSSYERVGVHCGVTPLEPDWSGYLTLEIVNYNQNRAVTLHVGEGIMQLLFFRSKIPNKTYTMRSGRYNDQPRQPVLPRMRAHQENEGA